MLSGQGVDPTSLLRSEGVVMYMLCNFHRLQLIAFTNNTGQQNLTFFLAHEEKYLILIELLTLNSNV